MRATWRPDASARRRATSRCSMNSVRLGSPVRGSVTACSASSLPQRPALGHVLDLTDQEEGGAWASRTTDPLTETQTRWPSAWK